MDGTEKSRCTLATLDLRFGCHQSIRTDRGPNFESEQGHQPFTHNPVRSERMNCTFPSMLAKCVDECQQNLSHQLR